MENNKAPQLSEGFEEVEIPKLSEGFEEIPVENTEISGLEAAKTKFFDTIGMDLTDEISGGLEAAGQAVGLKDVGGPNLLDVKTTKPLLLQPDRLKNLMSVYEEAKAKRSAMELEQEKAQPTASMIGTGAGLLATAPLNLLKGAKALGKALPVAEAALQGTVAGFGASEGSVLQDPGTLLKDTLTGTGIGGGLGKAGEMVSSGLSTFGKSISDSSKENALKALGYTKKQLKKIKGNSKDFETLKDVGGKAQDLGLTGPFMSNEGRYEKIQDLISQNEDKLTKKLGDIDTNLQSNPDLFNELKVAKSEIVDGAVAQFKKQNPEASDEMLNKFVETIKKMTTKADDPDFLNATKLQAKKIALNQEGKYNKIDDVNVSVDAARNLRSEYKKAIEKYGEVVNQRTGANTSEIKNINKDLGDLFEMRKAAEDATLKDLSGKMSLTNKAGVGFSLLDLNPKALAASTAVDAISKYGQGIASSSKRATGDFLKNNANSITSSVAEATSREGTRNLLQNNNVNSISEKSPEAINALATKSVQKYGKDGEKLSNLLKTISQKSNQGRTAAIFGMMQNPDYRMKLNELNNEEQEPQE